MVDCAPISGVQLKVLRAHGASTLLAGLLCLVPLVAQAQNGKKAPRIAVIADGPSDAYNRATRELKQELEALLKERYADIALPDKPTLEGTFSEESARAIVQQALADTNTDIIVSFGVRTGRELGKVQTLPKPVFLPFAHVPSQQLPRDGARSGKKNLGYLTGLVDLERELRRFREVIRRERAVLVVDQYIVDSIEGLDAYVKSVVHDSMQVSMVSAGAEVQAILAAIPEDAEAVYLGPLLQLRDADVPALLEGLNARGLPTYASEGREWVEKGAFVSLVPAGEQRRRLRKIALHIEETLEGSDPGQMDTTFGPRAQLAINMHTARRIRVWPRFELMTEAELVGEESGQRGDVLSFRDAVKMAMESNLNLAATRRDIEIADQDLRSARGQLAPTLTGTADYTELDPDIVNPFANSQRSITLGLSGRQLIYSPAAVGGLRAQRYKLVASKRGVQSAELDVGLEAAEAYLFLLQSRTVEDIQRSFLARVRQNLALAEVRVEIGASGRQDVFRWQIEIAGARANVIQASAGRNQAEINLNRTLNRPLEASVHTAEPTDPDTGIVLDDRVRDLVGDPWSFRVFREFMALEAVGRAPELAQLDAAIDAQEQVLKALRARLFLPDVFISGGLNGTVWRGGDGAEDLEFPAAPPDSEADAGPQFPPRQDFSWQVGAGLQMQLFEQPRYAELNKKRAELAQLRTQRDALAQVVEQRVRAEMHSAGFTSAAVQLRRDAAEAANRNLELVTDAYRQGTVNIITLIDAQNQALQTELNAANAVYEFLLDFVQIERASGRFSFLASKADQEAFVRRLIEFTNARRATDAKPQGKK